MEPSIPIDWLCCPLSGQPLHAMAPELLARMEAARQSGTLRFATSPAAVQIDLQTPLQAALLREDGTLFYLVSDGIPVLLPDHALLTEPAATTAGEH